jgi:hypothetical protein
LLFLPFPEKEENKNNLKIYYYDKKFQMAFIGFANLCSL